MEQLTPVRIATETTSRSFLGVKYEVTPSSLFFVRSGFVGIGTSTTFDGKLCQAVYEGNMHTSYGSNTNGSYRVYFYKTGVSVEGGWYRSPGYSLRCLYIN